MGEESRDVLESIDTGLLLAEMRARRMSRNAIIEQLMRHGLTLDEATDAFEGDGRIPLVRTDGGIQRLEPMPAEEPVSGIGGWLLIPAINLVALVGGLFAQFVQGVREVAASQAGVPASGDDRGAALVALAVVSGLLGLAGYTAWLFFRRHRWAPKLFLALVLVLFGLSALSALGPGGESGSSAVRELVPQAVWGLVWMTYLFHSERARNTFTG